MRVRHQRQRRPWASAHGLLQTPAAATHPSQAAVGFGIPPGLAARLAARQAGELGRPPAAGGGGATRVGPTWPWRRCSARPACPMCASLLQVRPLGDVLDAGARPGPELGARGGLLGRSHRLNPQDGAARHLGSPGHARWPGGERALGPVLLQLGRSPRLRGQRGAACR